MSGKVPASLRDDDDTNQDDAMRMTMITFLQSAPKKLPQALVARGRLSPRQVFLKRKRIEDLDHRNLCASGTASGTRLLPTLLRRKDVRASRVRLYKRGANTLALRNGEGIASASDLATTMYIIKILRRNPPQRCCIRCVSVHCGPRLLSRRPSPFARPGNC